MKKLIIIALACYGLCARAQLHASKDFLYLYSDSMVYADQIRFQPDFSGNLRVRLDQRNIPVGQVKFVNTQDGFFANLRKIGRFSSDQFAERIIEGRINVFQERSLAYTPFIYNTLDEYIPPYMLRNEYALSNLYYNKGYGDLSILTYANLKRDLASHTKSMDILAGYSKSRNLSTAAYVTGAVSIIAGLLVSTSSGRNAYSMSNFTIGIGLGTLGLGLVAGGYLNGVSNRSKLEAAIDAYNR